MKWSYKLVLAVVVIFVSTLIASGIKSTNEKKAGLLNDKTQKEVLVNSVAEVDLKMPLDKLMVGVWQANMTKLGIWSDRYHFYDDGSFHYYIKESDCQTRSRAKSGRWEIKDNKILILETKTETVWEGGNYQKSEGNCTTAMELKGARVKMKEFKDPVIEQLSIIRAADNEVPKRTSVRINNKQFWKFFDDPTMEDK